MPLYLQAPWDYIRSEPYIPDQVHQPVFHCHGCMKTDKAARPELQEVQQSDQKTET